jgi:acetyl esterase
MKKLAFILCLIAGGIMISSAQNDPVRMEKVIYKNVDNRELEVDMFYLPEIIKKEGNPAIALFHGGGWVFGNPSEFYEACRRYAAMGFITFSFQYRLSVKEDGSYPHPDITPVESTKDARSAIRWLRENAWQFNINPDKIVVGGQSAGGQLALSTALCDQVNEISDNLEISPEPNALLLFSSNVNTMEAWTDMLLADRRKEIWSISPYHNLRKGMPPAIAFHGDQDDQVLFYIVRMFQSKMLKLGNHYELYIYPGRKHYLGEGNEKYARYFDEEILKRTDDFLKKQGFYSE